MNRNLWIALIVVVVAILGFMILQGQKPKVTPPVSETPSPTSAASEGVTIDLREQNESSESGTASLVEKDGKVMVTLNLSGAAEGVAQPAHIHMGACPNVGEVKYPLTSPVDGKSETTLEVALDQLKGETPLAVNVHKSASEANIYVACGDLVL